jgi:uncharacterized coiled-coil protein SlyX
MRPAWISCHVCLPLFIFVFISVAIPLVQPDEQGPRSPSPKSPSIENIPAPSQGPMPPSDLQHTGHRMLSPPSSSRSSTCSSRSSTCSSSDVDPGSLRSQSPARPKVASSGLHELELSSSPEPENKPPILNDVLIRTIHLAVSQLETSQRFQQDEINDLTVKLHNQAEVATKMASQTEACTSKFDQASESLARAQQKWDTVEKWRECIEKRKDDLKTQEGSKVGSEAERQAYRAWKASRKAVNEKIRNGLELYDKAKLRFNKATILHDDAEHDLLLVTTEQDQEIKQHLAIQDEFDLAEKRMKKINQDLREIQELLDHDGICCCLHVLTSLMPLCQTKRAVGPYQLYRTWLSVVKILDIR